MGFLIPASERSVSNLELEWRALHHLQSNMQIHTGEVGLSPARFADEVAIARKL